MTAEARKGWRHIAGGRPKLRRALYMAAISAIRSNPVLRRFYQQLRQRNKPPKSLWWPSSENSPSS
jgi:Transposase IS116/IS110/IS902 family.